MNLPKGWTDHFVLILCADQYHYHPEYLVIKVMMYGWCTHHYWIDYPSSEQIREAVLTHPDFKLDETEYFLVGDCLYCKEKHEGLTTLRLTTPHKSPS